MSEKIYIITKGVYDSYEVIGYKKTEEEAKNLWHELCLKHPNYDYDYDEIDMIEDIYER